jgi:hypothetical protein
VNIFAEPGSDDRAPVSVTSFSLQIDWPNTGNPCPPKISLGDVDYRPTAPPASPVGIQAVVLDFDDLNNPAVNAYYSLVSTQHWSTVYEGMWDNFAREASAAQKPGRALFVATFGMDAMMPPNEDALEVIQAAGGNGAALTSWLENCDPGSMAGRTNGWISYPISYVLVGVFGQRQGAALELVSRTGVYNWLEPPYPVNQLQATL